MPSPTVSFGLALVFLLGVCSAQDEAPVLVVAPTRDFALGMEATIGASLCAGEDRLFECVVENCASFNPGDLMFTWTINNQQLALDQSNTMFEIVKNNCNSTLKMVMPQNNLNIGHGTDVTCTVMSASGQNDTATSYLYTTPLPAANFRHFAFGVPGVDDIIPTANTLTRLGPGAGGEQNAAAVPFLGEMMEVECLYGGVFPDPTQVDHMLSFIRPFVCIGILFGVQCAYQLPSGVTVVGNFTFDVYEENPFILCGSFDFICGRRLNQDALLVIHDPARIHEFTGTGGEVSVTGPDFERNVGDMVTICCEYSGINTPTVTWTGPSGATFNEFDHTVPPEPMNGATEANIGVRCISFTMSRQTEGTYTCCTENHVDEPEGEKEDIAVTLSGDPPVAREPQSECVDPELMDTVTLDCTPQSSPGADTFTYVWIDPSNNVLPFPDSQFSIEVVCQENNITCEGNYTCEVSNSIDTVSTVFQVAVAPKAEVIVMVTDEMGMTVDRFVPGGSVDTYFIRVGDTVVLLCDNLRGNEIIEIVTPNGIQDSFVSMNVTVESFTNGTYTCSVSTPAGPQCPADNEDVVIRLIGDPPVIPPPNPPTDPPENGDVFVPGTDICIPFNGNTVLDCTVLSGTPVVSYEWTKDDDLTVISTSVMLNVTEPGSYKCLATNVFGADNATSIVIESPKVAISAMVTSIVDDCGRLMSPPSSGICPIVGDDVEITCDLDEMGGNGEVIIIAPDGTVERNDRIALQDVAVGDAGLYTCMATNDLCTPSNATIFINITGFPPRIPPPNPPLEPPSSGEIFIAGTTVCIPLNGNTILDCTVEPGASPVVAYQWTSLGTPISMDLMISVDMAGSYTCSATNDFGNDVATSLVIESPGVIPSVMVTSNGTANADACNPSSTLCDSREGDVVIITCFPDPAGGPAMLSIETPNGTIVPGNTIMFDSIELFEAGTYHCIAENNASVCTPARVPIIINVDGIPPEIPPPRPPPPGIPFDNQTVDIGIENICITNGSSVTLYCNSPVGSLPINYFWLMEGSTSSDPISTGQFLTVFDSGMYTCVANNSFGQDNATSTVLMPPEPMLTVQVMGDIRGTLTGTCRTLIQPLPPDSNIDHCPYVGEDIEVCCTSSLPGNIPTLEHNGQVAGPDPKFRYPNAMIPDYLVIDGAYTCTTELQPGCSSQKTEYVRLFDPAVISQVSPLPDSTNTTNVVGVGRHPAPVPIPPGNDVMIYCPYSGLDDPTGQTEFLAVDSEGNEVPSNQLPSPKYTIQQLNDTLVLTISNYLPDDLYHTFICNTRNLAGADSEMITLIEDHAEWCCDAYGQCDMECHLGIRTRNVYCCQRNSRNPVDEERCNDLPKPPETQQCTEFGPCESDPMWQPLPWSQCSVTCGGGYQIREVVCVIPGEDMVAPESQCEHLLIPALFQYCSLESCCQADLYHSYCKLIATTSLCARPEYQQICCWTCKTYFYT